MRMVQTPGTAASALGGQDRQGTSPGAWGRGAALEMRGQESPGALRGLGSTRGVFWAGQGRGEVG